MYEKLKKILFNQGYVRHNVTSVYGPHIFSMCPLVPLGSLGSGSRKLSIEIKVTNLSYKKNLKCVECLSIIAKILCSVGDVKGEKYRQDYYSRRDFDFLCRCSCGRGIIVIYEYVG